jgi:hypothetical protein
MNIYIWVILALLLAFFVLYWHGEKDDVMRRYLVTGKTLAQTKRPFLWIHTTFEPNARHWVNFGSRMTSQLNQPYKFMTIKSIIDHCADDFNICLVNDDSFAKVIPGWKINMENVSGPVKTKLRTMGLFKLLRQYGGLIVPDSFVCSKSLLPLVTDKVIRGENLFYGAPAEHPVIDEYTSWLEQTISKDYTSASAFDKDWWSERQDVQQIPPFQMGVVDTKDQPITLERLMGNSFINVDPSAYGVYIPDDRLLESIKYGWFARLSAEQVLRSDTIAGKLILLAQKSQDIL